MRSVHAGGDPFGQGVHGCGGHLDDLERFFGETIELAPQAVEFAGRRHESRPNTERQRREPSRDQFVRILPERDLVRS